MARDDKQPSRRSIRLEEWDYSRGGMYFVTICVQGHKSLLGKIDGNAVIFNDYGHIVQKEWIAAGELRQNVSLDMFVIMPNHLHGIIAITDQSKTRATHRVAPTIQSGSLGAIIGQFKSVATKRIRKQGLPTFKWQRSYFEHVIRDEDDLLRIREYIFANPFRWEFDRDNPEGQPDDIENEFWHFEKVVA